MAVICAAIVAFQNCSQSFSPLNEQANLSSTVAPVILVENRPAEITNLKSVNITYRVLVRDGGSVSSVRCSLDDLATEDCLQGFNKIDLPEGNHQLKIVATDNDGRISPEVFVNWIVDSAPPAFSFVLAPPAIVSTRSVDVTYSISDDGTDINRVVCTLNGTPVACTNSGLRLSELTAGAKSLRIVATDLASNSISVVRDFQVQFNVPSVTLTSSPPGFDRSLTTTFSYTGMSGGQVLSTFECSLNGTTFTPCGGSYNYVTTNEGNKNFYVRSIDSIGTRSSILTYSWVIDRTLPLITFTSPAGAVFTSSSASVAFTVAELNPSTRLCSLDGVSLPACNSPVPLSQLTNGSHSLRVIATDRAGNVGSATYAFTVRIGAAALTLHHVVSGEQLLRFANAVRAGQQPESATYANMRLINCRTYTNNAINTYIAPSQNADCNDDDDSTYCRWQHTGDSRAAWSCAIQGYVERDPTYFEASARIVRAWATRFQTITGSDGPLVHGYAWNPMIWAADLLEEAHPGFTAADAASFRNMLVTRIMPQSTRVVNGNNWESWRAFAAYTVSIHVKNVTAVEAARTRLLRHITTYVGRGYSQETTRDMWHAQMGIAPLAYAAETAYHRGDSALYQQDNNAILRASEHAANILLTLNDGDRDPVTGATIREAFKGPYTYYQVIVHHYRNRRGLSTPSSAAAVASNRWRRQYLNGVETFGSTGWGTAFYRGDR